MTLSSLPSTKSKELIPFELVPISDEFSMSTAIAIYNPLEYEIKYENATHYALTYMRKHFKSISINQDFSYVTISKADAQTFLDQVDMHIENLYTNCPDNINKRDLFETLFLNDTLKVMHTGWSAVIYNVLNKGWSSTLVLGGYSDIVLAKTLPGNAFGLYSIRPTSFVTISTIGGLCFSFVSTVTPHGPTKRVLGTISKILLIPATSVEIVMNFALTNTAGRLWPQLMSGVALNVTKTISSGPGASIYDLKDSGTIIVKALKKVWKYF